MYLVRGNFLKWPKGSKKVIEFLQLAVPYCTNFITNLKINLNKHLKSKSSLARQRQVHEYQRGSDNCILNTSPHIRTTILPCIKPSIFSQMKQTIYISLCFLPIQMYLECIFSLNIFLFYIAL